MVVQRLNYLVQTRQLVAVQTVLDLNHVENKFFPFLLDVLDLVLDNRLTCGLLTDIQDDLLVLYAVQADDLARCEVARGKSRVHVLRQHLPVLGLQVLVPHRHDYR